jgi:hypothetical protein
MIGLMGSCFLLDEISLSKARPPKNLRTIADFQVWKRGSIVGQGTYENSGITYTVMLAPAGRFGASGPSAYLFNDKGDFVDWTADMGDFYTVHSDFNLTGGVVTNIDHKKR